MVNVPPPETLALMKAVLLGWIFIVPALLRAKIPTALRELWPEMAIVPALAMLDELPRKFAPLTLQVPPARLLNVDDDSETLPEIVPVLLMTILPLKSATATLEVAFPNRFAVMVPLLVRIAACVLALLICITVLADEPSDVIEPELLTEMTPLTLLGVPMPVPTVIPAPPLAIMTPWLTIETFPPPCANAFTPAVTAEMVEDASIVALRLPTPLL